MNYDELLNAYQSLQTDYNIIMEKYLNLLNEHITLQQKYLDTLTLRNPEDAYREDFSGDEDVMRIMNQRKGD